MTETPDDSLEPEDEPAASDEGDRDEEQGLSAEESLSLLPPD